MKIIAERLGSEPLQIGAVLEVIHEIDKAKASGIGIDEMAGPVFGVRNLPDHVIMLGLGAGLVIAWRLVDAVLGKAP